MVKPDTFIVSILAEEKRKTTKEGFAAVNEKIAIVKTMLIKNGVKESDIQSVNIGINPNYVYDSGASRVDGFIATHGLSVKIRALDSVDSVLEWVSATPDVRIQSTSYDVDDKTPLYKDARDLAIKKARQKAEDIALASWVSLGKITSISESQNYTPPMYNQYAMMAKTEDASVGGAGISAWELEISTNISITYEIK